MHHLSIIPPHSLAALPLSLATVGQVLGTNAGLTGLVAVILVLAIPIVAIVGWFYTQHRKEQLWHDTARLAIEKGQPIPARPPTDEELKSPPPPVGTSTQEWERLQRAQRRREDVRNGLIMLAVGAALHFGGFGGRNGFLAYVPMFTGIAFLLNGLLNGLFSGKSDDSGGHPPQS